MLQFSLLEVSQHVAATSVSSLPISPPDITTSGILKLIVVIVDRYIWKMSTNVKCDESVRSSKITLITVLGNEHYMKQQLQIQKYAIFVKQTNAACSY